MPFFSRYRGEDAAGYRRVLVGDSPAVRYPEDDVGIHWTSAGQYYVRQKTCAPPTRSGSRRPAVVHFKLIGGLPAAGKRRYLLCEDEALVERDGELFLRFRCASVRVGQAELDAAAVCRILGQRGFDSWAQALGRRVGTRKPARTLLAQHLSRSLRPNARTTSSTRTSAGSSAASWTISSGTRSCGWMGPKDEASLEFALRPVADRVIALLEQGETLKKRLWLKRKLVVESHHRRNADRVPRGAVRRHRRQRGTTQGVGRALRHRRADPGSPCR